MEQDQKETGAARSQHVVHVLPADDARTFDIVRTQVERLATTTDEPTPGLRLLVLTPTSDDAGRLARAVNDALDPDGALLVTADTRPRGLRRLPGAAAVVVSLDDALALIARSALKLDAVEAVVLMSLDVLAANAERLDNAFTDLPKGAARIATTSTLSAELDAVLERHARKARRISYDLPESATAATEYVLCDRAARTDILARILDLVDPAHATVVASEEDAEQACSALAQLGYGPDDELVSYSDGETPEGEPLVVVFTAPIDPKDLDPITEAGAQRVVVLVAPDERAAFLRAFGAATRPLALPLSTGASGALEAMRDRVRVALAGPLHHQLVALAPLFAEHDPAEVAAALLALHESAEVALPAPAAPVTYSRPRLEPSSRPQADRPTRRPAEAAAQPSGAMTSLFVNVGEKDGARKGDLVGAITNEAGISSELLGRITMRDMFSVVEVDSAVAERVIEALNGKNIRGRVVNARVDRKPDGDRGERGGDRGERRGPPRNRRDDGDGPPRRRSFGGGSRGGFGDRPRRDDGERGSRSTGRGGPKPRFARDGERPRRSRDDAGGPRPFRDDDRSRGPRAMGEHREWQDRGERLRNTRRPRRGDD